MNGEVWIAPVGTVATPDGAGPWQRIGFTADPPQPATDEHDAQPARIFPPTFTRTFTFELTKPDLRRMLRVVFGMTRPEVSAYLRQARRDRSGPRPLAVNGYAHDRRRRARRRRTRR